MDNGKKNVTVENRKLFDVCLCLTVALILLMGVGSVRAGEGNNKIYVCPYKGKDSYDGTSHIVIPDSNRGPKKTIVAAVDAVTAIAYRKFPVRQNGDPRT